MTDPIPPTTPANMPTEPRFYPWRDAYGREHPEIPRCVGSTHPRNSWSRRSWRDCQRKGVVQRGTYASREAWFCLQHDPAKRGERRVEKLAPILLELLREGTKLMPVAKDRTRADWLRRAEAAISKAEGRAS